MSSRSDCTSTPMRVSRLVGLDSMSTTAVLGSGLLPHPASSMPAAKAAYTAPHQVRLDIRDLAEDGWARGSGSCRDIARQPMPSLPGEQGEGDGLLGFGGDAVIVGGLNAAAEGRKIGTEHAHEREIARASAGDDVVDRHFADARCDKLPPGKRDAARGERCRGREYVVRGKALRPRE